MASSRINNMLNYTNFLEARYYNLKLTSFVHALYSDCNHNTSVIISRIANKRNFVIDHNNI